MSHPSLAKFDFNSWLSRLVFSDCSRFCPEGKRKRGRPKTTWWRTVEKERSQAGWQSWREVRTAAQDKNRWKAHVEALCATLALGDKWSEVKLQVLKPTKFVTATIKTLCHPSHPTGFLSYHPDFRWSKTSQSIRVFLPINEVGKGEREPGNKVVSFVACCLNSVVSNLATVLRESQHVNTY